VNDGPAWIAVGRIGRAHGVKGEVSVLPLSEVASRFEPGSRLFLSEGEDRPVTVRAARRHHSRVLVAFQGVTDRDQAEAMQGAYLFVPASEAPTLPEGAFWTHELVGCLVVSDDGRELGRVREVMHTPANDVWAVDGEGGEVLVPALRDVVASVDVVGRRIVVHEIPGLTAP
jgi:16S rRNA processing protein RimM